MKTIKEIRKDLLTEKEWLFHDAKLIKTSFDYDKHLLEMELDITGCFDGDRGGINARYAKLTFNGLKLFSASLVEPWHGSNNLSGMGFNKNNVIESFTRFPGIWRERPKLDNSFRIFVELLSGDNFNIVADSIVIDFIKES